MKKHEIFFLVQNLKKGDLKAFEKLYKMYYSKLFAFSKKFSSSTLQPEDYVQQTFLKLWENREKIKEDLLFDKQIFTICKNLILNDLQREKKVVSGQEYFITSSYSLNDANEEIPNKYLGKIKISIEKMPKKRKEVFLLHKIENLSYEEIAAYLSISSKSIANHLYLANNFLKKELKKL